MLIAAGRLIERPCPDCANTERRAFGEAESARGELASYAIGWTSGHEEEVGQVTIGIGAGNEGGGSFHIEVRVVDREIAMALVDRPFEDVPEGGPDLTRDEALAHEDLPYIWLVADAVMAQDRRAWWMEHWLRGTTAGADPAVREGAEPVHRVARGREGGWQLHGAAKEPSEELAEIHLFHALDDDPSLLAVLDLAPGERARRRRADGRWKRKRS